jgi:hypothetical protein
MWQQQNWELHTHGSFLSYPHHDAAGLCTYVYVKLGAKLWALFCPKITCETPRWQGDHQEIEEEMRSNCKPLYVK